MKEGIGVEGDAEGGSVANFMLSQISDQVTGNNLERTQFNPQRIKRNLRSDFPPWPISCFHFEFCGATNAHVPDQGWLVSCTLVSGNPFCPTSVRSPCMFRLVRVAPPH